MNRRAFLSLLLCFSLFAQAASITVEGPFRHAAGSGELASDAFTRADAANLGANWTAKNGGQTPGIFSNAVDVTVTGDQNIAYYNAVTWPNDQYSQATVVAGTAANRAVAVGVRLQAGADRNGYYCGYDRSQTGDANRRLWKFTGGTSVWQELAVDPVDIVATEVIKCQIVGTTLKLFVNAVERLSVTVTDYASGNAGIYLDNAAQNVALLDTWSGGAP